MLELEVAHAISARIERLSEETTPGTPVTADYISAKLVTLPVMQEVIKDAMEMRALRQQVTDVLTLPGR